MKKATAAVIAILMAALVISGCSKNNNASSSGGASSSSSGGAKTISIMFQGSDAEQAAHMASTKRFTEKTGINVELLYTPHDSYTSRLAGYQANNKLPDIISVDGPNLPSLVWGGYIEPIENWISKSLIDDMTPSNIEQCTYPIDGKLYAIGQADSTVLLYANKSYLERVGARIPKSVDDAWTIQEFDELLGKLAALPEVTWPLDIIWANNIAGSEWGIYAFYECLVSAGTDVIDRTTWKADGTLNSAAAVDTLKYFQKWNANGWIVPKSAGDNSLYNDRRQTAIAWNGNWGYTAALEGLKEDFIALPLPNFGKGTRTPNATWIWSITSTSPNKKEAGELLEFMMTDTQWLDDLIATGSYPALKSFAARCKDYNDPNVMAIAYEQSNYAVVRPPHPAYPIISMEFANAFESILNGTDAKAALDKAAKAIDDDIKDNDGYPPFGK